MARKPARSRTIRSVGSDEAKSIEAFHQEDQIVRADLRRIGVLAGGFLLFLLVLAVVIR